ncbi:hypothetical protein KFL_010110040 [Klebsormidium nitens]|uniref:Uncharacterized protein n=1 Tax=Klebsormidium nitens TaxID=105231 RepID=A0A1Y1IVW6_KLENI|nr:hypothetical protein KFL_010110040 [Klebsormidium nitens]|eukprot:GAQ92418.1 hypothetical protein KFL_010110040 [Klebsormidium nitens]
MVSRSRDTFGQALVVVANEVPLSELNSSAFRAKLPAGHEHFVRTGLLDTKEQVEMLRAIHPHLEGMIFNQEEVNGEADPTEDRNGVRSRCVGRDGEDTGGQFVYTRWTRRSHSSRPRRMQLLLTHKKLWKGVTDPAGDAERTKEARALIGLHVRQQHRGAILAAENAKVVWDALKKTYKSKSAAQKLQLRHELSTLKMQSGESVAAYVGRAQDLYRDLLAAGSNMKPDDLSFSVLAGLSSRFEGVVTVLTTTKEELGKVEELL